MNKIFICLFVVCVFAVNTSFSQDYKTGIGLRGGWTGGLTAKHFIKEGKAIEGILSSGWGWRGYQITGLYEIHKAAFTKDGVEGFFWYYGAGAHFGGYRYNKRYPKWNSTSVSTGYYTYAEEPHSYVAFGIDGVFGLEYKIEEIPVTLSLDVKPFIEITTYDGFPMRFWDGGFSIRYVF